MKNYHEGKRLTKQAGLKLLESKNWEAIGGDDGINSIYWNNQTGELLINTGLGSEHFMFVEKKKFWIVQTWYQYKLGGSPFKHSKDFDEEFESREEAEKHALAADCGLFGDTRYRYEIIDPK
jgi:hypothetical protein